MNEEKNNGNSSGAPAFSDKPMFEGDWQCSECGKAITQLPFQPGEDQVVSCKECYIKKRNARRFDRPMVEGSWQCSDCGKEITQLPFRPGEGKPIFCRDCYQSKRG